jgi:hypothetical protein
MKSFLVLLLAWTITPIYAQALFPQLCIGTWTGTMHIASSGTIRDSVQVRFTVAQLTNDSWTWRMEYLSPQQPVVKDYLLKLKDKGKGIFSIDEGDGIELMDYKFGNKLYSAFEIPGTLLTASYELINSNTLVFEVTSGKKTGTSAKEITNYSMGSVQRVVLKRN